MNAPVPMEERILKLLERKDYVPLNIPELLKKLRLQPNQQQQLQTALVSLAGTGRIARIKGNRYIIPRDADLVPGIIRMTRQGKGILQPDDPGQGEIIVNVTETSTALHNDYVLVRRDVSPKRVVKPGAEAATGTVVRILERRRTQIVGTLCESGRFWYVIPDDPRIPHDIYVPPARDVGRPARAGDKVVARLDVWESRHTNPEGEIIEVLGPPDEEGVDMLSVLRQHDLPLHFPRSVLDEAGQIRQGDVDGRGEEGGARRRVDCREQNAVTIDPDDAKDFDDAICVESMPNGQWKVWVHIADVSHYVRAGSALDLEARKRGNSTYLVDRVIPMLPEKLSNDLCSLKPNEDRFTKCVEIHLGSDGNILSAKFYPAVIRSKRRFTYRQALSVLEGPPGNQIEQMLHLAHQLAQSLRRRRFRAGALNLDFPETKIRLDESGRVASIDRVENDISHQLIEEYMLLANETVAGRLMALSRPAVHRIHEPPNERRLGEFREEVLSREIPCGNLTHRGEIQKLLRRLEGLPIGPALQIGFLKSMMRARYAVEPLGHYGLSKKQYTHFTSPIRRYADLVVHRALFERHGESIDSLRKTADHLSGTERNSSDAERASRDVKLFAYLEKQLRSGDRVQYEALVTDIRNFGFFIDVQGLGMSGLVHLSALKDDFYVLDARRCKLVGRRTRRTIRLGEKIRVVIFKVDSFKKQVDFELAPVDSKPLAQRSNQQSSRVKRGKDQGRRR